MAKFRNLSATAVDLPDENGINFRFEVGETRSGLSNYFANYTSSYIDRPILALVGALDGDGSLPVPSIRNENTIRVPGASAPYAYTAQPTNTGNPAVAPVDLSAATGPRRKSFVLNAKNETADANRQVDTNFVGIPEVPTLVHTTSGLTDTGLNASSTYTVETGYFPIKEDGLRATAADAEANPAVEEGEDYTAFGVIEVTDVSPAQTGIFYFAITGTSDIVFVADDANDASLPDPVVSGSGINLTTGVLTLAAFTGGAAGDSAEVEMTTLLLPDTAAKVVTALAALDSYQNGLYRNPVSGRLFLVEGETVQAFNADASATFP